MNKFARRAGRLVMIPVMAGAAVLSVVAPASAAPTPPAEEDCSAPVDGVTVCKIVTKVGPESTEVSALVRTGGGNLEGALVVLEACDGVTCNPVEVATGENTAEVATPPQTWGRGVGYYRANASWVDEDGHTHTGVVHPD